MTRDIKILISVLAVLSAFLPATAAFGEGIDEYTVLMLHCDGKNGSKDLADSSRKSHVVSANGHSKIDTAQSRFGGASCLFDGGFKYFFSFRDSETLSIPPSEDWDFGNEDFTVDFWVCFDKTGDQWNSAAALVSQHSNTDDHYANTINYWKIEYHSSSLWNFAYVRGGIQQIGTRGGPRASPGTWYHVAVVRHGDNWNLYVDGKAIDKDIAKPVAMPDLNTPLYIGGDSIIIRQNLKGRMDEIRISKCKARWTSDFTPPDVEYR